MSKKLAITGGLGLSVIAGIGIYMVVETNPALATVDQSDPKVIMQGSLLYDTNCASCHGKNLEGQPNWQVKNDDGTLPAPPHDKDGHTWHHDDGLLFNYTKDGGASLGIDGFVSGMPPFRDSLTDDEIWSVLAFIKSTWPERHRTRQALTTEQALEAK